MTTTTISENQLLDYVSKREFNDLVSDMRDFREETGARFESIESRLKNHDKRFNDMNRKFDELKEDMRVHTGVILDQFKEYVQISKEHMQGVEERLTNRMQVLEDKIK